MTSCRRLRRLSEARLSCSAVGGQCEGWLERSNADLIGRRVEHSGSPGFEICLKAGQIALIHLFQVREMIQKHAQSVFDGTQHHVELISLVKNELASALSSFRSGYYNCTSPTIHSLPKDRKTSTSPARQIAINVYFYLVTTFNVEGKVRKHLV